MKLDNEKSLETAEQTLEEWARVLADANRDREAADALRLANQICSFRCEFLAKEKS